jgi:cytochrome c biogenesis protein CcmG/thiol:disulfide interchange protein DsbE
MVARARALMPHPIGMRAVVLMVCIVALGAVFAWRLADAGHAATTALPASSVGRIAPDFTVADWSGSGATPVHLESLRGHPVIINFWAPWCDPCQAEAPVLKAASERESPRGVVFVGIAEDSQAADVAQFLRQHGLAYRCGPDTDGSLARAYGLFALPSTVAIDRNGVIRDKIIGQLNATTLNLAIQHALHAA